MSLSVFLLKSGCIGSVFRVGGKRKFRKQPHASTKHSGLRWGEDVHLRVWVVKNILPPTPYLSYGSNSQPSYSGSHPTASRLF